MIFLPSSVVETVPRKTSDLGQMKFRAEFSVPRHTIPQLDILDEIVRNSNLMTFRSTAIISAFVGGTILLLLFMYL